MKRILEKLITTLGTLFAISVFVFLAVRMVPGDPASMLLGERASPEALIEVRRDLGLDQPLFVQYGIFIKKLVFEGDLGRSIRGHEPVTKIISDRFPATIELASCALLFAILVGIPLGILAGISAGGIVDFFTMSLAVVGVSMPIFWLGLMLVLIFGLWLEWLPLSGRLPIEIIYDSKTGFVLLDALITRDFELAKEALRHLVLPAIALGTIPMAFLARMTRASMQDVLSQDFIRTARAKGLSPAKVYLKHALSNTAIPIITLLALQFGLLLGGAIITETIFSWPGMGTWLLESISARDYPAIMGGTLVVASSFVIINQFVDLIYKLVDPRLRH